MPRNVKQQNHLTVVMTKSDMIDERKPRAKKVISEPVSEKQVEERNDIMKSLKVIRKLEEEKLRLELKGEHKQKIIDMLVRCRSDLEKQLMLYETNNKNAGQLLNYIGNTTTKKRKNEIIQEENDIHMDEIKQYGLEKYAHLISPEAKKKQ